MGRCLTLFGGDKGWNSSDWTASDDRVRGGKSQSYLDTSNNSARFYGNLDIKTLGGAGFASQRTVTETQIWNLSDYDGIKLEFGKFDNKTYTFTLKDEILPPNPENGRDQSTTSYEYDFNLSEQGNGLSESSFVIAKWDDFTATYRGKERKDAPELDKENVKRISIMIRSFFGDQEGDFSLTLKSIEAVKIPDDEEKGVEKRASSQVPTNEGRWLGRSRMTCILGFALVVLSVCCVIIPAVTKRHMKVTLPW